MCECRVCCRGKPLCKRDIYQLYYPVKVHLNVTPSCCFLFTPCARLCFVCFFRAVAQNRKTLHKLGITHVLNAAHSKQGSIGDQTFYGDKCVYFGIPAEDSDRFDLSQYFKPAADFIHKALKSRDGTVYEHDTRDPIKRLYFCTFSSIFFHILHPALQERCWCIASWASVDRPLWSWCT